MYDESDSLGGLAFDRLYRREPAPVITYRLSNGRRTNIRQAGRCPSRTSCAPWNTLSSMRAVARHLYNGTMMGLGPHTLDF
jgi:hypothetical protein